jgi:hypothetical protein
VVGLVMQTDFASSDILFIISIELMIRDPRQSRVSLYIERYEVGPSQLEKISC